MQSFEILGKTVGPAAPTFIIAEAGSNHNGDIARAHQLIDVAADARADAVKFQTFRAERLYPKSAGRSDYLGVETSIYDIIEAMEMPYEWLPELRDHSHERGLAFLSTPFHEEAVELLDEHVDAFKLASYELTHDPLLQDTARRGKPVILSTGASAMADVAHALSVLKEAGAKDIVLLQCTAAYPAPPDAANVRALVTLREQFQVMTGLSDHTRDATAAPMAAAALGAVVIEKHFTMSNSLEGPDHAFAVEPDELAELVSGVRAIETVLGDGDKLVLDVEEELYSFARRSIFATGPIPAGQAFSRDNVDVLRAGKLGKGLPPSELPRVLNAVAARDIAAESPLQVADVRFWWRRVTKAEHVDAIVIGGNIRGLVTAYVLSSLGYRALLVDKAKTLGGADGSFKAADGSIFEFGMHVLDFKRSALATALFSRVVDGAVNRIKLNRGIVLRMN